MNASNDILTNISHLSLSSSPASSLTSNDSIGSNTNNNRSIVQIEALFNNFQGLHDNDLNQSLATNSLFYPTMLKNSYNEEIDFSLPVLKLLHHANHEETDLVELDQFKFNSRIYGKNVKFNRTHAIAYRTSMSSTNAYAFIDKEMIVHHSLCIQIIDIDLSITDNNNNNSNTSETSLAFGCTNCPVDQINKIELPNDSYELLNREEYWIVNKNILNNPSVGDELCFLIDNSGKFMFISFNYSFMLIKKQQNR